MKTKVTSMLVVFILSTISCTAQRTITVEAVNNDISDNLDLQAVASTFGESSNLEDFERKLNDYDSQISNLDLNNDGEVDYLRVIENMENNVHVVVVQAVLGRDVYQDVATIVVEKRENRRTRVQVIGDPYLYGNDYIIEPVYVYTPSIFSFFWGYNYQRWNSPYYYGYYPRYFHNRHPFEINFYMSHIGSHINHDHRYFYADHYRNEYAERLHNTMKRNDYETRYPDRNFSNRNNNVSNRKSFDAARTNNTIYDRRNSIDNRADRTINNNSGSRNNNYSTGSRNTESRNANQNMNQRINTPATNNRNQQINRTQDDIYQRRYDNTGSRSNTINQNNRNTQNNGSRSEQSINTPTYTPPTPTEIRRNPEVSHPQNNTYQRPERPANQEIRQQPTITREPNSPPAPVMNQPSRQVENKTIERKPAENTRQAQQTERKTSTDNASRR